MRLLGKAAAFVLLILPAVVNAQNTTAITQTVNKRNTIGVLSLGTGQSSSVNAGAPVVFTYQLLTAGAPPNTSDTVQFYDNFKSANTAIGSAAAIQQVAATNLLPYSQVNTANGWTTAGTAPTVTPAAASGADQSSTTATNVTFADATSAVSYQVSSGAAYASQAVTFSVWASAATAGSINLTIADGAGGNASSPQACALAAASTLTGNGANGFVRCSVTATLPSNAAAGFTAKITGATGETASLWGAQVEQASTPGPYVSTIGSARTTTAYAASLVSNFSWSQFDKGSHAVTVQYTPAGSTPNFVASTSNPVSLTIGAGTATISVADSPAGTSVYGAAVTLTASIAGVQNIAPDGQAHFTVDGTDLTPSGIALTCTGVNCTASITLNGGTYKLLAEGSHTIVASLANDDNYANVSSTQITHAITAASASTALSITAVSSLNPSTYGDAVTFTVTVQSTLSNPLPLTGTVTITDGSTTLGSGTVDANGKFTLTVPGASGTPALFNAGSHSITATYTGDPNYQ